jgi:hypothetical protein
MIYRTQTKEENLSILVSWNIILFECDLYSNNQINGFSYNDFLMKLFIFGVYLKSLLYIVSVTSEGGMSEDIQTQM